jgi:hypothetical protein
MSDDAREPSAPAVGQSQQTSGNAPEAQPSGAGGGETPQYLTREEVERLIAQTKEDIARQTQSLTDKAASRIDKRVKDGLENLNKVIALQKKAGIELTPEQERAARMQVYDEAIGSEDDSLPGLPPRAAQPGPVDGANQAQAAVVAFVNKQADKMMKKAGVELDASDPEASMLVQDKGPDEYLDSLEAALQKKAQRVKTPPEARIPTLGSGAATNLEAQYKAELEKVRQGDVDGLFKLKQKYKKAGLTNI